MIAVAITTRNRNKSIQSVVDKWRKHSPDGTPIFVVDDASTEPVKNADYRFEHNAGIAQAKNACLTLLMDTDAKHFFLADDDCYPISNDWWRPYVDSNEPHLSFTFDRTADGSPNGNNIIGVTDNGLIEYSNPCGCMLYMTRSLVTAIGGFDPDYHMWGNEHLDFSMRAYNSGFTTRPFLDIAGSLELFHSNDYHLSIRSTVDRSIKQMITDNNNERYKKYINSSRFVPYKVTKPNGIILASYFNSVPDPQRGNTWKQSIDPLKPLVRSAWDNGCRIHIFNDCFKDDDVLLRVDPPKDYSPNAYRFIVYLKWLQRNPEYTHVFLVDSTDVQVLRNPFQSLNPSVIYVGDEQGKTMDDKWMRDTQESLMDIPDYRSVIDHTRTLLNCGIIGGHRDVIMEFLELYVWYIQKYSFGELKPVDMALINYTIMKHFRDRFTHGIKVNTRFKKNEFNKVSFFKHK